MTQKEKVLAILRDSAGFGATADHITQQTGCRRVAARVDDLRKDGHTITGSFVDRAKGIYRYVLVSEVATSQPAEIPTELFAPTNTTARCAIDDDWDNAA